VVQWISSNICRCTGYAMIIEAVLAAARLIAEADHA
jgi:aerobic-type carbon monoxide dehydrogenase small subunit (CoxS/CutS family)